MLVLYPLAAANATKLPVEARRYRWGPHESRAPSPSPRLHRVLIPFSHILADLAWRFPTTSGDDVVKALGKEGKPI